MDVRIAGGPVYGDRFGDKLIRLPHDYIVGSSAVRNKRAVFQNVRALLREQELSLEKDGTIKGLKEQLSAIRCECGYLFGPDQPPPKIIRPGNRVSGEVDDGQVRKIMGLPAFAQGKDDF